MLERSFCEIFVSKYATAIRVAIAKELMEIYGISQLKASRLVGISQPLLSYAINNKRKIGGLKELYSNPITVELIRIIAKRLYEEKISIDMCKVCTIFRSHRMFPELAKQVKTL